MFFISRQTFLQQSPLALFYITAVFGPLAGGWVAGTNDLDQYIEVNMEEFYQIKQIHLQGQQDEANWVTSFRVYYVDNTAGNWTLYKNDGGEFVSLKRFYYVVPA